MHLVELVGVNYAGSPKYNKIDCIVILKGHFNSNQAKYPVCQQKNAEF